MTRKACVASPIPRPNREYRSRRSGAGTPIAEERAEPFRSKKRPTATSGAPRAQSFVSNKSLEPCQVISPHVGEAMAYPWAAPGPAGDCEEQVNGEK
jgi:hypothetical protein